MQRKPNQAFFIWKGQLSGVHNNPFRNELPSVLYFSHIVCITIKGPQELRPTLPWNCNQELIIFIGYRPSPLSLCPTKNLNLMMNI